MPREGKRSIGYRPFITCDDPRGVVACGTVRKHKNLSTVGGEATQTPTTYQLLEVSKGAHKLNHVVSSWSCGGHNKNNNNGESDMAKDLLQGTLDLGDSLTILTRLQLKKKTERGGGFDVDDLEIEDTEDAFDQIKRVIRSGVDGKNMYSDPSSEEACCDDRRLDSSDAPSTSSSQSSIVHSSNFVSPESLLPSTASKKKSKKPKGFNLIAKLMGIEAASLRSLSYNDRKYKGDGEEIVNQKKPAFDLDSPSPRARKQEHHDPAKSGWKTRTLDQMIEALKFKGNHNNSGVESAISSHHSESSKSKQRWGSVNRDHRPPIVIMKPSRFSCLNLDHPIIPRPRAEVDQEMLLKMRIRTNPLADTDGFETLSFNEKEMQVRAPSRKSSLGEGCSDDGKASSPRKLNPQKKHSLDKNAEEAQKMSGSTRKGERKRTPKSESKLQSSDGEKLINLKPKSSRGMNDTKIDILESATTNTGRQGKMSSSSLKKNWFDNAKIVADNNVPLINGNKTYRDESGEFDSICGRESLLLLEESTRLAQDASQIEITVADYVGDGQSSPSETPLSSNNRINTQTVLTCPNERGTIDRDKESQCSTSDIMPVEEGSSCSESSRVTIHNEEEENYVRVTSAPSIDHSNSRKGSSTSENNLKALLLRSPPFINRAEELFGLKGNPDQDLLQEICHDLNARMLLDCANELVDQGSECSRVRLPLVSAHKMSCVSCYYTCLEQLIDDVCDGIEALRCYMIYDVDVHSTDNLLLLVKGDLRSGKMVSGVWDIGWRDAGCADEIEEITRGVDELVMDGLIEEILVDLAL